jgi:hypothetical protein
VANNVEQQLSALDKQRQRLQQQREAALQSLQSASTQSDVQKYHAVLDGINGALAEVGQATSELYHRSGLKAQELAAGQQIYNASQAEQRAAAAYRGIDTDLSALPANQFRQGAQWGTDTATVGSDSSQSYRCRAIQSERSFNGIDHSKVGRVRVVSPLDRCSDFIAKGNE